MARHRNDPRGGARIMIAVSAVVVALGLLTVGAYALFGALDTQSSPRAAHSNSAHASSKSPAPVLAITVTGTACKVFVASPGDGDILINRVLQHGESFFSDEPPLQVSVSDGGAVDIRVHGVRRPASTPGQPLSFTVPSAGASSS